MSFAILGWGSLIWEDAPEFDKHRDIWVNDGPCLKLEFSRVSSSRLNALTLVIDPDNGQEAQVSWCRSKRQAFEDVICDLRCREGSKIEDIGRILATGPEPNNETQAVKIIQEWVQFNEDGFAARQVAEVEHVVRDRHVRMYRRQIVGSITLDVGNVACRVFDECVFPVIVSRYALNLAILDEDSLFIAQLCPLAEAPSGAKNDLGPVACRS